MTYRAVLRGYLLEEALAWLLRNTGYRILEHKDDDPDELDMRGETLLVKGRGAAHQVDVLGEFSLTPAFSLPIRMFIEAKFNRHPCGLAIVRNAHGVIFDVNENYVRRDSARPRRRFQYVYALFSTNGFTQPAQEYALAQQISLVDLSGDSFGWLKSAVYDCATQLYRLRTQYRIRQFPVNWLRRMVRMMLLGSTVEPDQITWNTNAPRFRADATGSLQEFAAGLLARENAELLLGFPAAPFILMLGSDDPVRFIHYADNHPSHTVRLRRRGSGENAEWGVTPWESPEAYRLTFNLPEQIESWIGDNEQYRLRRANQFKTDFLSAITVYRRHADQTRIYQLRYEPAELHRPISE
jgi:hypothetical protein